jgi:ubiquinone/menaquinone biosynthesis C-methylase UbiE
MWSRRNDDNLRAALQQREYETIVARIATDEPRRILDWGCGWGQMSDLLVRAGIDVDAFDYRGSSAPNDVVSLERFPHLSAYISSEPVRLPYPDAHFDAVLSCGVLEHVVDPDGSLEELKRILRPDGTIYVYKLPNRYSYLERIARSTGLDYHGQGPHDRLYTPTSARALLTRHGYTVLELRYANMIPLTFPRWLAGAAASALWTVNRALSRVPILKALATNVELAARAPSP